MNNEYFDLDDKELQEYYNTLSLKNATQEHIQEVEKELESRNIPDKMNIELTNEETTYRKETKTLTYNVNGKEIRVYKWNDYDEIQDSYDQGYEIDTQDEELLTDEELEALEDELI